MSEQAALTKRQIITELTRAPHGALDAYLPVGRQAAAEDPAFFAHLIAWNNVRGEVRDAKVALPVVAIGASMLSTAADPEYFENALAHVAGLGPREFVRALDFLKATGAYRRQLTRRLVTRYLRDYEAMGEARWERRVGLLHRATFAELYDRARLRPAEWLRPFIRSRMGRGLPGPPVEPHAGSVLADLRAVAKGGPVTDRVKSVPFLVLAGALGSRLREGATLAAVIRNMDYTTLVSSTARLTKLGMLEQPEAKAAYEATMAEKSAKATTRGGGLKAARAAQAMEDAAESATGEEQANLKSVAATLRKAQERQLDARAGIDGDWLVFVDTSGSMLSAIEAGRQVAAVLARSVRGKVHLVCGDTTPTYFDATGKTLAEIQQMTRGMRPGGGTSLGCGLQLLLDRRTEVDGIAIISDGGENETPYFANVYRSWVQRFDTEPTVYWYKVGNVVDWASTLKARGAGIDVQSFDLTGRFDYTSLPNLVQTMRVGRYSLLDEVQATPLLTLDDVLSATAGLRVLPQVALAEPRTLVIP